MAISLTLRLYDDVYVGRNQVILKDIQSPTQAVLTFDGTEIVVGPETWVDMMQGCQVRLGKPRDHWTADTRKEVRIQFEAPEYLVLRGSSYRNKRKEAQ